MKNLFRLLPIVFIAATEVLLQTSDPLLKKKWINQAIADETDFYFRFSKTLAGSTSRQAFDVFGRRYANTAQGPVFTVEHGYSFHPADCNQLDLHVSEARSLVGRNYAEKAFVLLNGIMLCMKRKQETQFPSRVSREANQLLDLIREKYLHRMEELHDQPASCYFTDENNQRTLEVEGSAFPYKLKLPDQFAPVFPQKRFLGKRKSYSWIVSRYYFDLPGENQSIDNWEDVLFSMENGKGYSFSRVIFIVGSSYHFNPQGYEKKNYYILWDLIRGINERRKETINFRRNRDENGYASQFEYFSENREIKKVFMHEMYYLRGDRGFFFLLAYPQNYQINGKKLWLEILSSIVVK